MSTMARLHAPKACQWRGLHALLAIIAVLFVAVSPLTARADAVDDILARFATDRFPDTEKAIGDLAASGHPTAAQMLEALGAERLRFSPLDKRIFILGIDETSVLDAKTGAKDAAVETGALKKVRLNNAVRSALQAAQGSLGLMSPDPVKRRAAAEAVLKARDPAQRAGVEAALAAEKDAKIKEIFTQARAGLVALYPERG